MALAMILLLYMCQIFCDISGLSLEIVFICSKPSSVYLRSQNAICEVIIYSWEGFKAKRKKSDTGQ